MPEKGKQVLWRLDYYTISPWKPRYDGTIQSEPEQNHSDIDLC